MCNRQLYVGEYIKKMGKGLRGGSIKLQKTLAGISLQTHEMGSNSNYQAIAK